MAQDEFVDLYAVLGVEPDADVAAIRARATALYLEAQNNLDHRNPNKRLQWQQLYEVYLPQARHLLLDSARRAEYNRYLAAYRSGKPLAEIAPEPVVVETGGLEIVGGGALEATEAEDIDPEVLAAEREEVWGKWKSSLGFEEGETASAAPAPTSPQPVAPEASDSTYVQVAPQHLAAQAANAGSQNNSNAGTARVEPRAARPASGVAARQPIQTVALGEPLKVAPKAAPQRLTPEDLKKQGHGEWERKRAVERDNLLGEAAAGAGLTGSFIGGGVALVVALTLVFVVDSFLAGTSYPLGMSRLVFTLLGFALAVAIAAIAAAVTAKKLRLKKLSELQTVSLEELQRRRR